MSRNDVFDSHEAARIIRGTRPLGGADKGGAAKAGKAPLTQIVLVL